MEHQTGFKFDMDRLGDKATHESLNKQVLDSCLREIALLIDNGTVTVTVRGNFVDFSF